MADIITSFTYLIPVETCPKEAGTVTIVWGCKLTYAGSKLMAI